MTERKVVYYPNGNIWYEVYYLNGVYHREDNKPAYISYGPNGNIQSEEYFLNGELHREGDKPAINYYKNGNIESEEYFLNGELHREGDKPQVIKYSEDGMIETWYWYDKNNDEIKKEVHDISVELTKACKD